MVSAPSASRARNFPIIAGERPQMPASENRDGIRSFDVAIMMEKLYDALRAANVPDDKARAAAVEAVNVHDSKSDIVLLKGMFGFNLALTLANTAMLAVLLGKAFWT